MAKEIVKEEDAANELYALPVKELPEEKISFDILRYVPEESARHYEFVPIGLSDGVLEIGIVDPNNLMARDAIQFISSRANLPFRLFLISRADFDRVMDEYKNLKGEVSKALSELEISEKDEELGKALGRGSLSDETKTTEGPNIVAEAPVTKIVAVILNHAAEGNASDVHIEPTAENVRVRFRVDGTLYTSLFLPQSVLEAIVARVKILTNMKLDEKRKPQDGRFSAKISGRKIDFRVSVLPTNYGEKVVIRILDQEKGLRTIDKLGLSEENMTMLRNAIKKPYGLILLTGPTGSGKTTTLAAMMNELDREKANVISLEDPIEYNIEGVSQSQIRPEIEYTFASGLRSILRQDPDIIMVGEIRDKETAMLAIQAALTGHLVFSTLHTNSAIGVVPRLIDMGVDPYLIAPTLILSVAQRLVRIICPESKDPVPIEDSIKVMIEKQLADLPEKRRREIKVGREVYRAKRAPTCPSGTRGRIGVYEMFEVDKELEKLILETPSETAIEKLVRGERGMLTMKDDALIKALDGVIPFEEVNTL